MYFTSRRGKVHKLDDQFAKEVDSKLRELLNDPSKLGDSICEYLSRVMTLKRDAYGPKGELTLIAFTLSRMEGFYAGATGQWTPEREDLCRVLIADIAKGIAYGELDSEATITKLEALLRDPSLLRDWGICGYLGDFAHYEYISPLFKGAYISKPGVWSPEREELTKKVIKELKHDRMVEESWRKGSKA